MDQDLPVRERAALVLGPAGEQNGSDRHRDSNAHRAHVRLDELHRVVDRETRTDVAAGRIDVERDVLLGILGLEVKELSVDDVCDLIVDCRADEDNSFVQQPRVDVECPLPSARLLDHGRNVRRHAETASWTCTGAPAISTGTP